MYKRSGKKQLKDYELRTCERSKKVCMFCLQEIDKGEDYYYSDILTACVDCAEDVNNCF